MLFSGGRELRGRGWAVLILLKLWGFIILYSIVMIPWRIAQYASVRCWLACKLAHNSWQHIRGNIGKPRALAGTAGKCTAPGADYFLNDRHVANGAKGLPRIASAWASTKFDARGEPHGFFKHLIEALKLVSLLFALPLGLLELELKHRVGFLKLRCLLLKNSSLFHREGKALFDDLGGCKVGDGVFSRVEKSHAAKAGATGRCVNPQTEGASCEAATTK